MKLTRNSSECLKRQRVTHSHEREAGFELERKAFHRPGLGGGLFSCNRALRKKIGSKGVIEQAEKKCILKGQSAVQNRFGAEKKQVLVGGGKNLLPWEQHGRGGASPQKKFDNQRGIFGERKLGERPSP